jgi:hypothetical protein
MSEDDRMMKAMYGQYAVHVPLWRVVQDQDVTFGMACHQNLSICPKYLMSASPIKIGEDSHVSSCPYDLQCDRRPN